MALALAVAVPLAGVWLVVGLAVMAAAGSLWLAVPFDGVCRAAWWALLGGGILRAGGVRRWLPASHQAVGAVCVVALLGLPNSAAAREPADDLLRVFLTPVDPSGTDETMALVP